MPYTNCTVCGAKALVGATRCPRCQAPFVSYDPKGERVETVNCPNCGVQRPVAIGVCPNCLMSTAPSGRRLTRALLLAGATVVALMTVGYFISRGTGVTRPLAPLVADSTGVALTADTTPRTDSLSRDTLVAGAEVTPTPTAPQLAAAVPSARLLPAANAPPPTVATAGATARPAAPKPAPPPSVPVADTGRWEYALANTWVRVRGAPTRESEVLRMVDSAQRVRLGPPTNGWRPIRVGVDRGWVDPRLFTVIPAPPPRP
jgi:hypothetical protein